MSHNLKETLNMLKSLKVKNKSIINFFLKKLPNFKFLHLKSTYKLKHINSHFLELIKE